MTRVRLLLPRTPRLVLVVVLVAASVVLAAAWPEAEQQARAQTPSLQLVNAPDEPSGPIAIIGVDGGTTWSNAGGTVTIELENRGDTEVTASVWWLLADPEETRPWETPAGKGEPVQVVLPGRARTQVVVAAGQPAGPGVWTLSLWAHTVDGGGTTPSHGVNARPTVHVLPARPDVYRLGEPGRHAAINLVEPVGRLVVGGNRQVSGPDALVSLRALTDQPVHLELRCYLARPGTAEPWNDHASIGSYVAEVPLDVDEATIGTCRFPTVPTDGEWQLSAFLRRRGGEGGHEDGMYSKEVLRPTDGDPADGAGTTEDGGDDLH